MGGVIVERSNNQVSTTSYEVINQKTEVRETTKHFIERLSDGDDIEEQQGYDGYVIDYPLDYDP